MYRYAVNFLLRKEACRINTCEGMSSLIYWRGGEDGRVEEYFSQPDLHSGGVVLARHRRLPTAVLLRVSSGGFQAGRNTESCL